MLPKERVYAALEHREPDRIPWGEHSIDYNVYEDILGRETLVQAKMRTTQAYWDGRRDDVVASLKRDRLDLIRALEMDIAFVSAVPPADYRPEPYEKVDEETYRDEQGHLYRISATTHDPPPRLVISWMGMPPLSARSFMQREVQNPPWQRPIPARVRNLIPSSVRAPRSIASCTSASVTSSQRQTTLAKRGFSATRRSRSCGSAAEKRAAAGTGP